MLLAVSLMLLNCGGGSGEPQQTISSSEETSVALGAEGSLLFPPDSIPAGSVVEVSADEYPPLAKGLEPVGQAYKVTLAQQPDIPVQVKLKVPSGENTDNLILLRVEDDGTTWLLQSELVDGYLVAETPGFSRLLIGRMLTDLDVSPPHITGPDKLPVGVMGQYQEQALAGFAGVNRNWSIYAEFVDGELTQQTSDQGDSSARFKGMKAGTAKLSVSYTFPGTTLNAFARKQVEVVDVLDSFDNGFDITVYGSDQAIFDSAAGQTAPIDLTARILNTDVDEVTSWQCQQVDFMSTKFKNCGTCLADCNKVFDVKGLVIGQWGPAIVEFTAHGRHGPHETFGKTSITINAVNEMPIITALTGNKTDKKWTSLLSVFDFNVHADIRGGEAPYVYEWSVLPTSKTATHSHSELSDNFEFSLRFPGIYKLHLVVSDAKGSRSEGYYPVSVSPRDDFKPVYTRIANVPEQPLDIAEKVTLEVGVNGSLIVVEGEKVPYVVALDWGDGSAVEVVKVTADNPVDGGKTSFSHAYENPGEYAVKVAARARWFESADQIVPYHILQDDSDVSRSNADIRVERKLPVVEVTSSDDQGAENGPDTLSFTFTRSGDLDTPLTLNFQLGGSATVQQDYTVDQTASITIPANASFVELLITPVADNVDGEGDETVNVTLLADNAYSIGTANSANAVIADYVKPPTLVSISASDSSASEKGQLTGAFTVTRSGDLSGSLTVPLLLEGSASYSADYSLSPSSAKYSVKFPVGVDSVDIVVTPRDDADVEGEETVELSLKQSTAYEFGSSAFATVFIADRGVASYVLDRVEISKYVASNDLCGETMSCIHKNATSSFKTTDDIWTLSEGSGKYTFKEVYDITGDVLSDYQVSFSFDTPPARLEAGKSYDLSATATSSGYTQGWFLTRSFTYYYAWTRNGYRTSGGWQYDTQASVYNRDMTYDADTGRYTGGISDTQVTPINMPTGLQDQIEIGGKMGWDPGINIVWLYKLEN